MASAEGSDANDRPVHILFVGAGAVGCFYASRLHHPSENIHVSLVCRSNYSTIAASGITLETRNFGTYHFAPHAVFPSITAASTSASAPRDGWDYVVVTTKALPDITDDAADLEPVVAVAPAGRTCIVLIQNGVGIEQAHRARFPTNPIISAVTVISAEQVRHGVVRQNRWTRIGMGAYTDGLASDTTATLRELSARGDACVAQLADLFTRLGGLRDAEAHAELALQQLRWHKLCINAAMNPSAILAGGRPNADMAADPDLRAHLKAIMDDIFAAAPRILGRPFPPDMASPDQILTSTERNKGGKPSMLLDWERGAPLEIEVILGLPIRIARERGVELGRLQTVYALLKSAVRMRDEQNMKEEKRRKEGAETKL